MRHRPARGAGEIGARHYAALFGERSPIKNADPAKTRAAQKIQSDQHSISRNVERGKVSYAEPRDP